MNWQNIFKKSSKKTTKTQQLVLGDINVSVEHKKIKNLHLKVSGQKGEVRISAPRHLRLEIIRTFAISKLDWIKKQQEKLRQQIREAPKKFLSGENHYFLGRPYSLKVIDYVGRPKIILKDDEIKLFVSEKASKTEKEKILNSCYRKKLKELIPEYILKWETKLEVNVKEFGIKKMKTRWGTCNIRTKKIWLSLELAKKPLECIEYVVVHEMVHLLEASHNKRFIGFMDQFLPEWRVSQKKLSYRCVD